MQTPKNERKRRVWDRIEWLLMHLTLIFSGMFVTFWIISLFNWQMEFLTSSLTVTLMGIFFPLTFLTALLYIIRRAIHGVSAAQRHTKANRNLPLSQKPKK